MSLEFNNPLYIGDPDAAAKADISQLKQDVGDLSQLDTTDKSSLVNALNEAMDSTLNGASRNLDNLSEEGNSKLHALKGYKDSGELLTDAEGLEDVKAYSHSTFDKSKFTVAGSPVITDDGIASGFSNNPKNAITCSYLIGSLTEDFEFEIPIVVTQELLTNYTTENYICNSTPNNQFRASYYPQYGSFAIWLKLSDESMLNFGLSQVNEIKYSNLSVGDIVSFVFGRNVSSGKYYIKAKLNDVVKGSQENTQSLNPYVLDTAQYLGTWSYAGSTDIKHIYGAIDLKRVKATVDGVPVFSGNKTGIDTIKPDDYTVVGTPTISADGVASGFSGNSYVKLLANVFAGADSWEIITPVALTAIAQQTIFGAEGKLRIDYNLANSRFQCRFTTTNTTWNNGLLTLPTYTTMGITYIKVVFDGAKYSIYQSQDLNNWTSGGSITDSAKLNVSGTDVLAFGYNYGGVAGSEFLLKGSIDLNEFKIYVDGDLVYQPCLKIPYTESKTGSKIVDAVYRDRVNDMAEQFGYANYYTLSDTDFTLPQVELYGLIGQRTLRDSYRNGINYWELYSNRDLEQGGSCTSGVEVTFARPFADTNYVLSVPYSAKSATAFTPTQTGDWIAKGKGLL